MTMLLNSGTMTGVSGISTTGMIDTVTNAAGASISASDSGSGAANRAGAMSSRCSA